MSVDMTKLGALVCEQMDAIQETYASSEEGYEVTNCILIANVARKGSQDTGALRSRTPVGQHLYLTIGLLDAAKRSFLKGMEVPQ